MYDYATPSGQAAEFTDSTDFCLLAPIGSFPQALYRTTAPLFG